MLRIEYKNAKSLIRSLAPEEGAFTASNLLRWLLGKCKQPQFCVCTWNENSGEMGLGILPFIRLTKFACHLPEQQKDDAELSPE